MAGSFDSHDRLRSVEVLNFVDKGTLDLEAIDALCVLRLASELLANPRAGAVVAGTATQFRLEFSITMDKAQRRD